AHATSIVLHGLHDHEVAQMVEHISSGAPSEELCRQIVERSDGVPLFVEELTKAALEDKAHSLPASLHDSLQARLDRVPATKGVVQIGAGIGRSFSHGLVTELASQPEPDVTRALDELVTSGLAMRSGLPPDATYTFKHALVQDVVYESLLKSRRAAIHGRIVE